MHASHRTRTTQDSAKARRDSPHDVVIDKLLFPFPASSFWFGVLLCVLDLVLLPLVDIVVDLVDDLVVDLVVDPVVDLVVDLVVALVVNLVVDLVVDFVVDLVVDLVVDFGSDPAAG